MSALRAAVAASPSLLEGESRIANVSGAVLVGGASTRMGRDKSHLAFGGDALATRTARLLGELCEEVLLIGGTPPAEAPGLRVPDPAGSAAEPSALRGLVGALEAARAERVLVVATDMPLLTPELLVALIAWPEHDAVVVRDAEQVHPLCAIYRRDVVCPVARTLLAKGRLALRGVLERVDTSYFEGDDLARVDPRGRALTNVNTPEDFARVCEPD